MAEGVVVTKEEDASPKFELVMREEIMVDALPEAVWPYILNRKYWMAFELETLSGNPAEEGELVLVSQQANKNVPTQYLLKTVKIVPQKQIVSKVFPLKGDDFIGFSDVTLFRFGGRSKMIFSFYMEIKIDKSSTNPVDDLENIRTDSQLKIKQSVERIKRLVEIEKDR